MSIPQLAKLIEDPSKIKDKFIPIPVTIGEMRIDVLILENDEHEFELTRRPLEKGAKISDHRIHLPRRLHMEGIFADQDMQPSGIISAIIHNEGGFELTTWQEKKDEFLEVVNADLAYEVITQYEEYPSMGITYSNIVRDRFRSKACFFVIDMEEVEFVESEVASIDPDSLPVQKKKRSRKKKDPPKEEEQQTKVENQGTKQVDEKRGSTLKGGIDALRSLFGGGG